MTLLFFATAKYEKRTVDCLTSVYAFKVIAKVSSRVVFVFFLLFKQIIGASLIG
ncbi:hypothetical protein D104_14040 [Marinomonas profundimaris]|uniref:Uncharacterized protein n=1 Tax=Marinomonas profundimaris TaxID=1208321 RepID=W1RPM0_9GAMM|nr:hypothetical protein D104_14040 [Marinomonas profundimaris]